MFGNSAVLLLALACALFARSLSQDELKLLQDPGGWEYITISDDHGGIQTTHTCFDGQPHPDECSGTLTLNADNTFVQQVHIHGQTVARPGKYELDDDQIAFYDEFGTRDGPYQLTLDAKSKRLTIEMPQVRVELLLEKEYKKRRTQK
jgi:formylmethanofuran dehydrogenase subunit A